MYGWDGSAHDGKVFLDSLDHGLPCVTGKYWLGDAGYTLSKWCLTPYRGVRYHLRQWIHGAAQPQTKEELYNLRHSQLRNVIERIYGVAKKSFPILGKMQPYPDMRDQAKIVECCFLILNFRRMHQEYEDVNAFMEFNEQGDEVDYIVEDDEADAGDDDEDDITRPPRGLPSTRALETWRDGIATNLWNDYMSELLRRGIAHDMQPPAAN